MKNVSKSLKKEVEKYIKDEEAENNINDEKLKNIVFNWTQVLENDLVSKTYHIKDNSFRAKTLYMGLCTFHHVCLI